MIYYFVCEQMNQVLPEMNRPLRQHMKHSQRAQEKHYDASSMIERASYVSNVLSKVFLGQPISPEELETPALLTSWQG